VRFEGKLGSTLIGHTDLEEVDPPIGVAEECFWPTPAYSSIQSHGTTHRGSWVPIPELPVALPGRYALPHDRPTLILDDSADLNEIRVEVCGIPYPLYGELVPQHVEAYKKQFEK